MIGMAVVWDDHYFLFFFTKFFTTIKTLLVWACLNTNPDLLITLYNQARYVSKGRSLGCLSSLGKSSASLSKGGKALFAAQSLVQCHVQLQWLCKGWEGNPWSYTVNDMLLYVASLAVLRVNQKTECLSSQ